MGCENIQSFTIPGAVFAQIWGGSGGKGEQRDGKGEHGMGRGWNEGWEFFWSFFFLKKKKQQLRSFSSNLLSLAWDCISLNAKVS